MKKFILSAIFFIVLSCAFISCAVIADKYISGKNDCKSGYCQGSFNVFSDNSRYGLKDVGGVYINEENFPDEVFRKWLENGENIYGAGADGFLSDEELKSIKTITIRGSADNSLSDLKGIEFFTELTDLSVPYNSLTDLNLNSNVNIDYLNCSYNKLQNLNINALENLRTLYCEFNYLKELDLSGNGELTVLYSRHNLLEKLDLKNNTKLIFIETFDNMLKDIDVSMLTELEFLHIDHNMLTSLDMSNNLNLKGGGFVVRNNAVRKIILPVIDGFTVYYDDFAEQNPITGYERCEWYADEEYTIPVTGDLEAQGQTLYAKRIPNSYTVVFIADGAYSVPSPVKTFYDESFFIPVSEPYKKGYKFLYWSDDEYNEGTRYNAGQSVLNIAGDRYDGEKITLYAKWRGIDYSIVFDKNADDATGDTGVLNAVYGNSYNLPLNAFKRQGYDFEGWSLNKDGKVDFKDGQSVSDLTTTDGEVITLYAVWTQNASSLQQPYLDDLKYAYELHLKDDYYGEDNDALYSHYVDALDSIKEAGKNTTAMQTAIDNAVLKMKSVPTKETRINEIANIWKNNNKDAIQYLVFYPIPSDRAERYLSAVESAITQADINNLKNLSSLINERDREDAAYRAIVVLEDYIEDAGYFTNAAKWLKVYTAVSSLPLSEVMPAHASVCENLLQSYDGFTQKERAYIDNSVIENAGFLLRFSNSKKTSLQNIDDLLGSIVKSDYSQKEYDLILKIAQDAKNNILSAESESETDLIYAKALLSIEEVPKLNDPEPPLTQPPSPDIQPTPENHTDDIKTTVYIILITLISITLLSLIFALYHLKLKKHR